MDVPLGNWGAEALADPRRTYIRPDRDNPNGSCGVPAHQHWRNDGNLAQRSHQRKQHLTAAQPCACVGHLHLGPDAKHVVSQHLSATYIVDADDWHTIGIVCTWLDDPIRNTP